MKFSIPALVAMLIMTASPDVMGMTVELQFLPTAPTTLSQTLQPAIRALQPVSISSFIDKRQLTGTLLGEFSVNGQAEKVEANVPVADYATDTFKKLYEGWGGRTAANARLTLKGEITQFSFEESDGYQARVGINFDLSDNSGRVIWYGHSSGVVRGTSTVTPKTLPNVLSNALLATYKELFEDPQLVGVWSGKISTTYEIRD